MFNMMDMFNNASGDNSFNNNAGSGGYNNENSSGFNNININNMLNSSQKDMYNEYIKQLDKLDFSDGNNYGSNNNN